MGNIVHFFVALFSSLDRSVTLMDSLFYPFFSKPFLEIPGLLPFAVLSQTDNREKVLRQIGEKIEGIANRTNQSNSEQSSIGVFKPSKIDSLIPGIDKRYKVS